MKENQFYLKVAHALSECQMIELGLKLYITEVLALIRNRVEGEYFFNMSGKDYENDTLHKLIETFAKLNNNEVLICDLRNFKNERNFLAHKSIAIFLNPEGDLNYLIEDERRIEIIKSEARRLHQLIMGETHLMMLPNLELDNPFDKK